MFCKLLRPQDAPLQSNVFPAGQSIVSRVLRVNYAAKYTTRPFLSRALSTSRCLGWVPSCVFKSTHPQKVREQGNRPHRNSASIKSHSPSCETRRCNQQGSIMSLTKLDGRGNALHCNDKSTDDSGRIFTDEDQRLYNHGKSAQSPLL